MRQYTDLYLSPGSTRLILAISARDPRLNQPVCNQGKFLVPLAVGTVG
jgi:hypothetical protein